MTGPSSRRGFLRGLTTLPLIGGGVTLIGSPTAAAVPLTGGMMATYAAWLHHEARAVRYAMGWEDAKGVFHPCANPGAQWHDFGNWTRAQAEAQRRAPVILSAAGVPLTDAHADDLWGGPIG
ncbi:hypothetical protein [Methylobacterium nonmethylotrophicum]|uniref:Uncharacterized protein n=1 Tax=Methylobacterium nonmethylotrophicum TaxID=1141884 RepID=A0A4Z0NKE3_9HYPH|nr:hypothetical protein [Methylobacterium nonmethylotrophicum]TGD96197.1 hypothetical protein EU555_24905 [Methylobacterium nonmethylotrophicum]